MTSKEELRQIRHLDHELDFMLEQVEEVKTSLTRISPVLSDMPRENELRDKIGDGVSKMIELQSAINLRVSQLFQYKMHITQIINEIENPVLRRILTVRYFKEKDNSFEDIALAIGYSYFRTVRMHGEAIHEYTRIKDSKTEEIYTQ